MASNKIVTAVGNSVLAAAAVLALLATGPAGLAMADDQALPGAPDVRSSDMGVVNGGVSEVRAAQRGAPLGGVSTNANGGGLVQGGSKSTTAGVGNATLCGTTASTGFGDGVGNDALLSVDCGSDFIPYN